MARSSRKKELHREREAIVPARTFSSIRHLRGEAAPLTGAAFCCGPNCVRLIPWPRKQLLDWLSEARSRLVESLSIPTKEDQMKRTVASMAIVAAMLIFPSPRPADAQTATSCMDEAIASCDEDFPGGGLYESTIRGWCYIIRTAWCWGFD